MISPLRRDVLLTSLVLAVPVILLGLRGDFPAEDVTSRLLWCLAAGWVAVTLIRWASTPPKPAKAPAPAPGTEGEPAPTA